MGIVAVSTQIFVVGLTAQLHKLTERLFYGKLGFVHRTIADEGGVPRTCDSQKLLFLANLYVVVALSVRNDGHLLRTPLRGCFYPSSPIGALLQMVATAVHHEHLGRFRETSLTPHCNAEEA